MQVVHEFVGYARVWWAQILYRVLVLLSLGLVWALGFYTVHASLWTLQECALSKAEFVCVRVRVLSMQTAYLVSLFVCAQNIKCFTCCAAAHHRTPEACAGLQTPGRSFVFQIKWGGQFSVVYSFNSQ